MTKNEVILYIETLTKRFPNINSIWLFGSRANNKAKPDSDWDLLVFADKKILEKLKICQSLNRNFIDLMVVYNDEDFIEPWRDNPKYGNLSDWEWQPVTENEAEYLAVEPIFNEKGVKKFNVKLNKSRALKIWPI